MDAELIAYIKAFTRSIETIYDDGRQVNVAKAIADMVNAACELAQAHGISWEDLQDIYARANG